MPRFRTELPDAGVRSMPVVAYPIDALAEALPQIVGDRRAVLVVKVHGIHQLAVDVRLELLVGRVADPNGAGVAVALEMIEDRLGRPASSQLNILLLVEFDHAIY